MVDELWDMSQQEDGRRVMPLLFERVYPNAGGDARSDVIDFSSIDVVGCLDLRTI